MNAVRSLVMQDTDNDELAWHVLDTLRELRRSLDTNPPIWFTLAARLDLDEAIDVADELATRIEKPMTTMQDLDAMLTDIARVDPAEATRMRDAYTAALDTYLAQYVAEQIAGYHVALWFTEPEMQKGAAA